MLVRAVAISRQRLQTEAIGRLESDGNSCSHAPDSHAFRPTGNPVTLTGNKRTTQSNLLAAARQIRDNEPITINGGSFTIAVAPSNSKVGPVWAAATVGYEILKGGTFAILTPSKDAPYAKGIV